MRRQAGILTLALLLGAGSAVGAAACGEERGNVEIEGGGTTGGASGTSGTNGTTAETAPHTTPDATSTSP